MLAALEELLELAGAPAAGFCCDELPQAATVTPKAAATIAAMLARRSIEFFMRVTSTRERVFESERTQVTGVATLRSDALVPPQ